MAHVVPMTAQSRLSPPSIWFDPQYRSNNVELISAIKVFGGYLEEQEFRRGMRKRSRTAPAKRSFKLAIEAISCNLLLAGLTGKDTRLAMPLAHDAMWGGGRYANSVYGQHFLDIIDVLTTLKLITRLTRGYRFSSQSKASSLYRPTVKLLKHLPLDGLNWHSFRREQDKELIILKSDKDEDGRSAPIAYKDTKKIKLWRGQVARINKWLATAEIDIVNDTSMPLIGDDGHLIAPHRVALHRIFNNGNWREGGRLWGGFWMSMKKEDRQRIRIGGELIADVDYRQLYPSLAYARARADMPEGDFYDIAGDGSSRDGWKTLINAMLFAEKRLRNWPKDTKVHFSSGMKLRDAVRMIEHKHPPLVPLFGTGIGYGLMNIESEMLIAVVTNLFRRGVVALPLHDAVLVRRSNAEAAQDAMQYEFTRRTLSRRATVSIKETAN